MVCKYCGGNVLWVGPLVDLTRTECKGCGATNSQIPDKECPEDDDQ